MSTPEPLKAGVGEHIGTIVWNTLLDLSGTLPYEANSDDVKASFADIVVGAVPALEPARLAP